MFDTEWELYGCGTIIFTIDLIYVQMLNDGCKNEKVEGDNMRLFPFVWISLIGLLACADDMSVDTDDDFDTGESSGDTDSSEHEDTGSSDTTDISTEDTDTEVVETDPVEEVCNRWLADRTDMSEGTWSGSVDTCDAGEVSQNGIDNALRLVNLFRWLSGVPEVETNEILNQKAQECSLIMHAYGGLTHYPSENMSCYSEDGSSAAGKSNLSPYAGVYSVDLYMSDPGNETTLGHRRWILSNGLGPIGLGSTSEFSCMHVIGGSGSGNSPWTAWPPSGPVPYELMNLAWATLEETGWSIQSDSTNLSNATVTITLDDGTDLPVTVTELGANYGSRFALSMVPNGWVSQPGRTYDVHIEATGGVIDYSVELIDCTSVE